MEDKLNYEIILKALMLKIQNLCFEAAHYCDKNLKQEIKEYKDEYEKVLKRINPQEIHCEWPKINKVSDLKETINKYLFKNRNITE